MTTQTPERFGTLGTAGSRPTRWGRSDREFSVAMTGTVNDALCEHLIREDGQEDITFALYRRSTGAARDSALVFALILPGAGDRQVHGNASFSGDYFLRAAAAAADAGAGLVLLHSHPRGRTWQLLSHDDRAAEASYSPATEVITGLPLLGMTLAVDSRSFSARLWSYPEGQDPAPHWATSVRVIGPGVHLTFNPNLRPAPAANRKLTRTVSAWGPSVQADIARLKVVVAGAGSVAQLVAEALVRSGFAMIDIVDFDLIQEHNLDRLLHATAQDIGKVKSHTLADVLREHAVADNPVITSSQLSIVEPLGLARVLDADVVFSCVDRPWPRYVLNMVAYAHLIPVVDGGVSVDANDAGCMGAEWRAHMSGPMRRCLECLHQYDAGDVGVERAGKLDDPRYIEGLPAEHHLRRRENVFAFSMACAANEILELLRALVGPGTLYDVGATTTHWATSSVDLDIDSCEDYCPFATHLLALGDDLPVTITGAHPAAEAARAAATGSTITPDPERPLRLAAVRRALGRLRYRVSRR